MTESPVVSAANSVAADKPRRRVPLWVLWTTFVVMLALTLLLNVWLPWQRKLDVIEEIESLGGGYDVELRGPEWFRDLLGHPYHGIAGNPRIGPFDEVTKVNFSPRGRSNVRFSSDLVSRLVIFPELSKLDLSYSNVTDDWMPQIAENKSLRSLNLPHCKVSGRGFGALKALPHLETVNLTYCPLSDGGLERLAEIPTLTTIGVIRCSRLTPDGIEKFKAARPDVNLYGAP